VPEPASVSESATDEEPASVPGVVLVLAAESDSAAEPALVPVVESGSAAVLAQVLGVELDSVAARVPVVGSDSVVVPEPVPGAESDSVAEPAQVLGAESGLAAVPVLARVLGAVGAASDAASVPEPGVGAAALVAGPVLEPGTAVVQALGLGVGTRGLLHQGCPGIQGPELMTQRSQPGRRLSRFGRWR